MHLLLLSPLSLNTLTKREMIDTLPNIVFSSQRTRRLDLVEAISNLPEETHTRLEQAAREKKSKRMVQPLVMNYPPPPPLLLLRRISTLYYSLFQTTLCKFHLQFIDETGNGATMTATCAICAGSFFLQELACCHRISFARNEQAAARSSSSCSSVN